MKKIFIALLSVICLSSCSTLQDFAQINGPKNGLNVSYNVKKGTVSGKYKINKHFSLKY